MPIQTVEKQLREAHKRLFDELKHIPQARNMIYHTERSNGLLIAKPHFDPPKYVWSSELVSQVHNHLQQIWDFFEHASYEMDALTRALVHPAERRSSKKSL